jgi:hypothetical protein
MYFHCLVTLCYMIFTITINSMVPVLLEYFFFNQNNFDKEDLNKKENINIYIYKYLIFYPI